jgi:hypothetical protein
MNRFAVTLFLLIAPVAGLAQNRMPPIPAEKLTLEQKKVIELVSAPPRPDRLDGAVHCSAA